MPYDIVSVPNGYYVVGPSGRKSKKPLSMAMAKKQRTALNISKARSHGHHIPPPKITMSGPEFVSEHRRLVKTLKEGSRAKQVAEAARQAAELRDRMR
jgi:hypothetical protein